VYTDGGNIAWESGLEGVHNGESDAFRHCVTSCIAANEFGDFGAKLLGDLNEDKADLGGQPYCERQMDENNNAKGRELAQKADDDASCASGCLGALASGELDLLNSSERRSYDRY